MSDILDGLEIRIGLGVATLLEVSAAKEIESQQARIELLEDSVDDFIKQIADCRSSHTVCGQLTSLAEVVQKNMSSDNG